MQSRESSPQIEVHFRNVDEEPELRESIEQRCEQLGEEFPELSKFEVTLSHDGRGFCAHAHVSGRRTDLAVTHDWADEVGAAADQALDKLHTRIRKHHDKTRMRGRRERNRVDFTG